MKLVFSISISILTCSLAIAAINPKAGIDRLRAPIDKKHRYIENGTIIGGEAGTQSSILNIRRLFANKDGIERIILDLGDSRGRPLKGQVGYFHVSLNRGTKKLTLVLDQAHSSAIDQKKLQEIFRISPFVKSARILFDPLDRNITVEMMLKKSVAVEAFQLPSKKKASRLVLDLKGKKSS